MKKLAFLILIVFSAVGAFAQNEARLKFDYKFDSGDMRSLIVFEEIGYGKLIFTGAALKDKHYVLTIKEFTGGKLSRSEVALDSAELGDLGKVSGDSLVFKVFTKQTAKSTARFQFQFDRFSVTKEYKVAENQTEFALKDFAGAKPDVPVAINAANYVMAYMLPYEKKDGSKQYCEVAQSGANPEEFGAKYGIPTYFLIEIKFK